MRHSTLPCRAATIRAVWPQGACRGHGRSVRRKLSSTPPASLASWYEAPTMQGEGHSGKKETQRGLVLALVQQLFEGFQVVGGGGQLQRRHALSHPVPDRTKPIFLHRSATLRGKFADFETRHTLSLHLCHTSRAAGLFYWRIAGIQASLVVSIRLRSLGINSAAALSFQPSDSPKEARGPPASPSTLARRERGPRCLWA